MVSPRKIDKGFIISRLYDVKEEILWHLDKDGFYDTTYKLSSDFYVYIF